MYQVYEFTSDDTLDSIASKYQITKEELKRINGLSDGDLFPGNLIVVPKFDDSLYYKYNVKKGDNLYSVSRLYNQDIDVLYAVNGIKKGDYIYPGQELLIPKSGVSIYLTKTNDTLESVAEEMNVVFDDLYNKNKDLYLLSDQLIIYKRD